MIGELIGGRYRLERELGRGGFGAVYVAVQEDLGRRVALKLLHQRHLAGVGFDRFRREAELAQHLAHPNTVRLFDFGLHDGTPFIAFELLQGESLHSLLAHTGPLPPARVAHITIQILKSLMEAHERGIVHRDVKPANVFICAYAGEIDFTKVLDFGIAKNVADESAPLTATGEAIGTPSYMPPEQLSGGVLGPSTDLYAVGLIMAEMLCGARVLSGSAMDIALRQMDPRPIPFPDSVRTSPLWPVIERATQKQPAHRYASAREMLAAIEAQRHLMTAPYPAPMSATLPANAPGTRPIYGSSPAHPVPAASAMPLTPLSVAPTVPVKKKGRTGCILLFLLGGGALALAALGGAGYYFLDFESLMGRAAPSASADAGAAPIASAEVDAGSEPSGDTDGGSPAIGKKTVAAAGTGKPGATATATATTKGPTLGKACVSNADCKGSFEVCAAGGVCECSKYGVTPPRACGSRCVANTDPDNCGACGVRCSNDEVCTTNMGGSPQHPICYQCTKGAFGSVRILCGPHNCVAPNTDPRNCGGCNKKCAPGQSCEGGVCK